MYEIGKNVTFPVAPTGRLLKYPLAKMEIGDSFVIPPEDVNSLSYPTAIFAYGKDHGKKFMTRKQPDGSRRVWRVQ